VLYVLVGMAGVFAGVFRAPMTAVFMRPDILPPLFR
jgi:H+/Cl- antiporter ClcA